MAQLRANLRIIAAGCCSAALALVSGCRNLDNAQVDVLERELRQQEDYIYELEDYLIEYSEKLRQARVAQCPPTAGSTTTRPSTPKVILDPTIDADLPTRPSLPLNGRNKVVPPAATPLTEAPSASSITAPTTTAPALEAPAAETPPAESATPPAATEPPANEPPAETKPVSPEELEPPQLEVGPVGALPANSADRFAVAPKSAVSSEGPLLIPDPIDYQTDAEEMAASSAAPAAATATEPQEPQLAAPQNDAPRLTAQQLEIRRVFLEPDKEPKSKRSLLIVVEAVNATNEPVEAAGAASLMVMARDEAGALRRVARWDFTPEETAAAWQSSHLGDGLHLELPLENDKLPEGELELWARVVADDGAKLLTSADAPYRFDATRLVSMAEFTGDAALAAAPANANGSSSTSGDDSTALAEVTKDQNQAATEAPQTPKPAWRASSVRLDQTRSEGIAATAGAKPAGWSTTAANSEPRIASAAKSDAPSWKRSTRAAASTQSAPEWSADR